MAALESWIDVQLFQELKKKYPEVPDDIVTAYMKQQGNDKDRCLELLEVESNKILFGGTNDHINANRVQSELRDLVINSPPEQRTRSNSSSSNISSASGCSASGSQTSTSSWPPYDANQTNTVYRGQSSQEDARTVPISPTELGQFVGSTPTRQIPNISCSAYNSSPYDGQNQGQNQYVNVNHGNQNYRTLPIHISNQTHQPQVRQITVQHMSSGDAQSASRYNHNMSSNQPPGYLYTPQYEMRHSQSSQAISQTGTLPHSQSSPSWYRSISTGSYPLPQYPSENSLLNQQVNQGSYPSQSRYDEHGYQGYPTAGRQHSSQAMIVLQNPMNPYAPDRTNLVSPSAAGGSPYHMPGSINEPRLSPGNQFNPSPTSPGQNIQSSVPQSPIGSNKPLVVEFKSAGPEGIRSRIKFFENTTQSGSNYRTVSPQRSDSSGLSQGSAGIGLSSGGVSNPPGRSYFNQETSRPHVISIEKAGTSQDGGLIYKHVPSVPISNECRVPGHPPGPVKTTSVDSDPGAVFSSEYRHYPVRPYPSPASSQSSVSSSDQAQQDSQRPRSGSLQDDPAYTQALLSHQKSRMSKLNEDLSTANHRLLELKQEITSLEIQIKDRQRKRNNIFPSAGDIATLKAENNQMQAEIQFMTREIDLYNNGQTPLGVIDPIEQQNFFKNMNTGQRGSIYSSQPQRPPTSLSPPPQLPPREKPPRPPDPPPLPPRITQVVPPPPPPQPQTGSGDSEGDGEQWNCSACTFLNHPALNKCECCEMPRLSVSTSPVEGDIPDTYPVQGS